MIEMKCHFCKAGPKNQDFIHYYCPECRDQYYLQHVVTTAGKYEPDGTRRGDYAHIFIEEDDITYHIRLHLDEGYTWIGYKPNDQDTMPEEITTLPGFPLNPANAKEKLKLYLTFS